MASANFPPDLAIRPLRASSSNVVADVDGEGNSSTGSDDDIWAQRQGIASHGLAGRLWEASLLLNSFLQPPVSGAGPSKDFEPPCSLFAGGSDAPRVGRTVLELGAGVGFASCELASLLPPADLVLMTDLPEVVPLMEDRRERFLAHRPGASSQAEVWVRPLAWGKEDERAIADELLERRERSGVDPAAPLIDLVIASDLVYFPSLYPPLVATLLALTAPPFDPPPDIVIAYKSRDLSKEAPFWDLCERAGFSLTPVVDRSTARLLGADGNDRMGIFVMRRQGSLYNDKAVGVPVAEQTRSVTFEDLLFLGMGDLHDSDTEDDEPPA